MINNSKTPHGIIIQKDINTYQISTLKPNHYTSDKLVATQSSQLYREGIDSDLIPPCK
jgi:hypothetical protein